jgi:hypothetical protein
MGTWGAGIFADDLASDIREDYRRYIGDGLSTYEATDRLTRDYATSLTDSDERCVFWLSLAAAQWRLGRLEERVKSQAIDIIDSGANLLRWKSDPRLLSSRKRALEKLRSELCSPQPSPRPVRKQTPCWTDWTVGELISYTPESGGNLQFHVWDLMKDNGGTYPVVAIIKDGRYVRHVTADGSDGDPHEVMIVGMRARANASTRLHRDGTLAIPARDRKRILGRRVLLWSKLDEGLQRLFHETRPR